ncbi:MAG: DUF1294 domain-containing protein [Acutalibacteraceae bacterium]|nr:DUF1294 domain-containing protein [Bacillota bacterium]
MPDGYVVAAVYLVLINIVAACLTVWDKRRAQKNGWRVRERTLLLVAILGGSPAMYGVMKKIRHKTKHKKFMIGLPVIFFLQVALGVWAGLMGFWPL